MGNMNALFGIIGLGCGLYCLYAFYLMRTKGIINTTVLLPQGTEVKKCKDKEGFIAEASAPLLILSIFAIIYGALELFNAQFQILGSYVLIGTVVFFVVLIWFAYITSKLRKKYFP